MLMPALLLPSPGQWLFYDPRLTEEALFLQIKRYKKYLGNNDQNRVSYFPDGVISKLVPPERFTFPFYYEPHPLTMVAAAELQLYLETQTDLDHNFGLTTDTEEPAIGKM